MIIDSHIHIFSADAAEKREQYFSDESFRLLYSSPKAKLCTADNVKEYISAGGCDTAWGMGFCWDKMTVCEKENEKILRDLATGENIIPFMPVPAFEDGDISQYIRSGVKSGFKGIGEVSLYQTGISAQSLTYLKKIFEAAAEENIPVCLHVNEPIGHHYPGKCVNDFYILYELIKDFQDVCVILSHWGGGILFYELMPEVKDAFKNVFYDTAATPYLYDVTVYSRGCDIVGADKILYGSDYPLLSLVRYEDEIRAYLDEEAAAKILGKNAAALIRK
ncbi:MAG: amidohydrolase family protein [Spirochaetota bacterium]